MLSETIKNNSTKTKQSNLRTKATKFGNMFQSRPKMQENEESIDILFQKSKLHEFIKLGEKPQFLNVEDILENNNIEEEPQEFEYIVEDPKEIVISLPLASTIELPEKLPFFKSITAKLATVYN